MAFDVVSKPAGWLGAGGSAVTVGMSVIAQHSRGTSQQGSKGFDSYHGVAGPRLVAIAHTQRAPTPRGQRYADAKFQRSGDSTGRRTSGKEEVEVGCQVTIIHWSSCKAVNVKVGCQVLSIHWSSCKAISVGATPDSCLLNSEAHAAPGTKLQGRCRSASYHSAWASLPRGKPMRCEAQGCRAQRSFSARLYVGAHQEGKGFVPHAVEGAEDLSTFLSVPGSAYDTVMRIDLFAYSTQAFRAVTGELEPYSLWVLVAQPNADAEAVLGLDSALSW